MGATPGRERRLLERRWFLEFRDSSSIALGRDMVSRIVFTERKSSKGRDGSSEDDTAVLVEETALRNHKLPQQ